MSPVRKPFLTATDWGVEINPDELSYFLNELYDRYQLPLMIVENGLGAKDTLTEDHKVHDAYRITYLREHIKAVKQAIEEDGVNVIGYTSWDVLIVSVQEQAK